MEGVQAAVGIETAHCTGLEARFLAQVTHAAEQLSREEANRIVQSLTQKYADDQKTKPVGKPFDQLYDVQKVKPLPEWQNLYVEVCQEFEQEYGLNL
jgi:methylamine--corrinoid protein Co-methyltransferase